MWLQKTGFAACLILLACGTSAQDKPANGVAAVRAANKLIDKNFTVARNTSFGDLITPENVLQTLRVSALFSPLSVTAVARVIAVDPTVVKSICWPQCSGRIVISSITKLIATKISF
jgi:hypothetical protein